MEISAGERIPVADNRKYLKRAIDDVIENQSMLSIMMLI